MNSAPSRPRHVPARGDVWVVNLEPVTGHEQGGERRPVVVFSADRFNRSAAGLVLVIPMTTVHKGIPWHVSVAAPEGGLRRTSYIKCEDLRSISTERLIQRWGVLSVQTMDEIADRVRVLLDL